MQNARNKSNFRVKPANYMPGTPVKKSHRERERVEGENCWVACESERASTRARSVEKN